MTPNTSTPSAGLPHERGRTDDGPARTPAPAGVVHRPEYLAALAALRALTPAELQRLKLYAIPAAQRAVPVEVHYLGDAS